MFQTKLSPQAGAPEAGPHPHLVRQILSRLRRQPQSRLDSAEAIWHNTLILLANQTPTSVYTLHFAGSQGLEIDQDRLLICLQSANSVRWVEARLMPVVRRALRSAGYELEPVFMVWAEQDND